MPTPSLSCTHTHIPLLTSPRHKRFGSGRYTTLKAATSLGRVWQHSALHAEHGLLLLRAHKQGVGVGGWMGECGWVSMGAQEAHVGTGKQLVCS